MTRAAPLHLAGPEDLDRLLPMVAACHGELGLDTSEGERLAALSPLLAGSPLGAAYLIGPRRAPVGYLALSFGWSLAHGGVDCALRDIWVRPPVRRRGLATEALSALLPALAEGGVCAISLETAASAPESRFYQRLGFRARPGQVLMVLSL